MPDPHPEEAPMDGISPRGLSALAALLLSSTPLFAWPLGEPTVNNDRYYPPPSAYGYNLFDRAPTYYGGSNYREYYNFSRGIAGSWANFPSDAVPGTARPVIRNRHKDYCPTPIDYVPTSHLFPEAKFEVHVPCDAEVWLEGQKTQQTGEVRNFISPALTPGEDYQYTIRARWKDGDREIEQEQRFIVHAGSKNIVRFPAPMPTGALPTPNPLSFGK
jgi:uncharacterized protein (TIGR03000 family)